MKKFFLMLLLSISIFSLAGCGNANDQPKENEKMEDVEEEDQIGDEEVDDE